MDDVAPDELRELVREVLRDALPELAARKAPAGGPTSGSSIPDSTIPDSTVPDGTVPDGTVPDGTVPDGTIAHNATTNSALSETTISEITISDYSRAESTVPESTVPEGTTSPDASVQTVRLSTNDELRAFVLKILKLADNPKRRGDLLAGRLRFVLADAAETAAPAVTHRVDKGAVTERAVVGAARAGARLVLGPRAVLTPLARDKARALRVPVEKER
jgi:hypothetical protein